MFIGRKEELRVLEETYKKPGFQMTVIYGFKQEKVGFLLCCQSEQHR